MHPEPLSAVDRPVCHSVGHQPGRPWRAAVGALQWEVTLAEVLSAQDYATAHYGKWHLGDIGDRLPNRQSFDEWYGIPNTSNLSMYTSQPGFDPDVAPIPAIMEGRRGETSRKVATFDLATRRLIDTEAMQRAVGSWSGTRRRVDRSSPMCRSRLCTTRPCPILASRE